MIIYKICLVAVFFSISNQAFSLSSFEDSTLITSENPTAYEVLVDSSYKYVFGYACGFAGVPPSGREAIEYLLEIKEIEIIKSILDGRNNIGKLYAIEALLRLTESDKIELSKEKSIK